MLRSYRGLEALTQDEASMRTNCVLARLRGSESTLLIVGFEQRFRPLAALGPLSGHPFRRWKVCENCPPEGRNTAPGGPPSASGGLLGTTFGPGGRQGRSGTA